MFDSRRIASIDIGSNTVLLLIAEYNEKNKKLITKVNYYEAPRISAGLKQEGKITVDNKRKLFAVLEKYSRIIEKYNCEVILVSATNAFRIASNAEQIISEIKRNFNFDVKILSGEEEARFSFLGATFGYKTTRDKLVIDIGGGSTEIIYGSINKIKFVESFNLGVVSLTEKFVDIYPVNNTAIESIKDYLTNSFAKLKDLIPISPFTISVAGTPTTLSCIKQNLKEYDENKIENSVLTVSDLKSISVKLSEMTPAEIKHNFGKVVEGREDVLLAGTLILLVLSEILKIDLFYVSGRGIRYGAIINYLNEQNLQIN